MEMCARLECGKFLLTHRANQQYCCIECWHIAQRAMRRESAYKSWKAACLDRDQHTCTICKKTKADGVKIIVHHVIGINESPELRHEIANGLTLCSLCHNAIHGSIKQSNPYQIFQSGRRYKVLTAAKK